MAVAVATRRPLVAHFPRVYLDSTVFFNFGEAGGLIPLVQYLGERARIVNEVEDELRRNSTFDEYSFLAVLDRINGWPPVESVDVTPTQMQQVFDIQRVVRDPGDHELKHLGEIASVVAACDDERMPVVSDDGLARKMCAVRGMPLINSADLAAEMTAADAIDLQMARAIHDDFCRFHHVKRDFGDDVGAAQDGLG